MNDASLIQAAVVAAGVSLAFLLLRRSEGKSWTESAAYAVGFGLFAGAGFLLLPSQIGPVSGLAAGAIILLAALLVWAWFRRRPGV